jgi:hypothetical protein
MAGKVVPPSISLRAFSCPHCGAFADQRWFLSMIETTQSGFTPEAWVHDAFEKASSGITNRKTMEEAHQFMTNLASRVVFARKSPGSTDIQLINVWVSRCRSCDEYSIWHHNELLHPPHQPFEIEPNEDLDPDIRVDFNEARAILAASPRGAAALRALRSTASLRSAASKALPSFSPIEVECSPPGSL